jgi:hypothetical protein
MSRQPVIGRNKRNSNLREKLESKADLRAGGVESPDRADALIGAIVLRQEAEINWKNCWRTRKGSNARCSSITDAQAVADCTSSGDGERSKTAIRWQSTVSYQSSHGLRAFRNVADIESFRRDPYRKSRSMR